MKFVQTMLLGATLAGAMSAAHADLSYTFDTDAQGFTVNDVAAGDLSWQAPGYLRIRDVTDVSNVFLVLPAADTTGNWAQYLGGTLAFDARLESPIASYWPEFGAVTLVSSLGTLTVDAVASDEPGTAWKTYSVSLDAGTWSGGDVAGFTTFLSQLQRVEINLEAGNGAIEVLHIDKLSVTAVPEASTWAMSAMGLVLMGALARRRKAA